jgi:hypothetical protein
MTTIVQINQSISSLRLIPIFRPVFNGKMNYEKIQFEREVIDVVRSSYIIFASQGLRFGSAFSPPLADLEYILRIHALIFHWLRLSEDVLHGAHVIHEM